MWKIYYSFSINLIWTPLILLVFIMKYKRTEHYSVLIQHANLKATKLQSKHSRVGYSVSVAVYVKQRKYMFQVSSSNNPIPLANLLLRISIFRDTQGQYCLLNLKLLCLTNISKMSFDLKTQQMLGKNFKLAWTGLF